MHRLIDLFVGTQSSISRSEYFKYLSRLIGLFVVVLFVFPLLGLILESTALLLLFSAFVWTIWGVLVINTKRLHDLGMSGWRQLLVFVPFGFLTGYTPEQVRAMLVHTWGMNPKQARETVDRYS